MADYPPTPKRPREIEVMLATFASVIEDRSAPYVGSPYTTGRRAPAWKSQTANPSDDFRLGVMAANKAAAAAFVRKVRQRERRPVIAPTELSDIDGWTQSDYRFFWGRVIESYVDSVIFLDGWSHSSGCAYEFVVA